MCHAVQPRMDFHTLSQQDVDLVLFAYHYHLVFPKGYVWFGWHSTLLSALPPQGVEPQMNYPDTQTPPLSK